MTELKIRLEHVTPVLSIKDMDKSRRFYIDLLGFKEADWGSDYFTSIGRDGKGLYLCKGRQGHPGTWVWVGFDGDIHELYDQLKANGATIRLPPTNFSWAMEMQVEDPDGHILRFGTDPDNKQPFMDGTIDSF